MSWIDFISMDFAFSKQMQIILFFISCTTTFLFYYMITNIILKIYGEPVSIRQKVMFVSISGLLLNNIWTYGVYYLGGMVSFSPIVYALITTPNPVFALLIYYCGIKLLRLSPFHSSRIINHVYLYFIAIKVLNRFVGSSFFAQTFSEYNYLLDALSLACCAVLNILICYLTVFIINRHRFIIAQTEQMFVPSLPREIARCFLSTSSAYLLVATCQFAIHDSYIHLFVALTLTLCLIIGILLVARKAANADITNKEMYINTLVDSIEKFHTVKHDFNNVLQAYEGYISIGHMEGLRAYHHSVMKITYQANCRIDLAEKMQENPALISLINKKWDYAEESFVTMNVNISCDLDLYIDIVDICRSVANLLDNAIEAAADSRQRSVMLSIEQMPDLNKLIVIKNSTLAQVDVDNLTRGVSTKAGHRGFGLAQVRKTLSKYGNCTFHLKYFDFNCTAYIAIQPI